MLMVWDGFVVSLKGCFRSEFGLKNRIYGSCQNAPATLGHAIVWIGAIVWLLVYSNFGQPIFLVRTSIRAFLDFMKSSLSLESSHMPMIGIWCSHHSRNLDHKTKCTNCMA